MYEIWSQLKGWIEDEQPFVLATVVSARNPSPRGIGSVLAISADGRQFIGSVSAGCVETEVIEMAAACMADGQTRWAEFGPSQGFPWEVAFSCGGKITVRVERFTGDQELVAGLIELHESHGTGLWIQGQGKQTLLEEDGSAVGDLETWSEETITEARKLLAEGRQTKEIETEDGKVLLRMISQPYRLFIMGAGHISLHLTTFARALNFQTIVVDPRESFAMIDRFETPPDQLIVAWPEAALKAYSITPFDSLVVLTHDPKIDDQALEIALRSDCSYIGALGSRKSHAARIKRLAAAGFEQAELDRIHGPVGLDIGSQTPAEIAVSIVAELVLVKNKSTDLAAKVAESAEE